MIFQSKSKYKHLMLLKISNLSSFCPRLASGHLDKLAKKICLQIFIYNLSTYSKFFIVISCTRHSDNLLLECCHFLKKNPFFLYFNMHFPMVLRQFSGLKSGKKLNLGKPHYLSQTR